MRARRGTVSRFVLPLGILAASALACGRNEGAPERALKAVRSEIVLGMPRPEVEAKLASLRSLRIKYVYVPRSSLELTRETTFEGRQLSGRFDVRTPHEAATHYMKQAVIYIELDEQERVANVRVGAIGFDPDA